MAVPRILHLEAESRSAELLARAFEREGFAVERTDDPAAARATLVGGGADLALAALADGGEELLAVEAGFHPTPVVLLADFDSEERCSELLRHGAAEVLVRPVEPGAVLAAARRALERRSLLSENERLREELGERFTLGALVSRDPRMRRVFRTVEAVADSRAGLLLTGESGTGKTLLARTIHQSSGRREGPFVVVNCGALPDSLLESELFGHARGAFTGAVRERAGKFEAAHAGTLFLDEIGTASLELQVKLLRVIEDGRFERVGETRTREVDVRIVAATNSDLEAEVAAGRFRSDLYWRIHVVGIEIPPLRERPADVALFAERFRERFAREHGRDVRGFEPRALQRLLAHDWPGNVRELENTVERAVLLARSHWLGPGDLWPDEEGPARPAPAAGSLETLPLGPLKEALAIPERWILLRALRHHDGNRQETARTLGINRTTLFNKMRKYGLSSFPSGARKGGPSDPPDDDDPALRRAG